MKWMSIGYVAVVAALLIACHTVQAQTIEAATGTATIANYLYFGEYAKISWTSHASNGKVTATISGLDGEFLGVLIDPGATAPTDNYDFTIKDENGLDILDGAGANCDTANSAYYACPAKIVGGTVTAIPRMTYGDLTLQIDNAGNSKVGVIKLFFRKQRRY